MAKEVDITNMEECCVSSSKVSIEGRDDAFCSSSSAVLLIQKDTRILAQTGNCRGCRDILSDICGLRSSGGEQDIWVGIIPRNQYSVGLIVMVMIYATGHISGAHFNPAVTIIFAIFRHFPYKRCLFTVSQLVGSLLASGTLCILFDVEDSDFFGTTPVGPHMRSFFFEIIISFLLMFVISGVATDNRSIGELAGIAVGMTITLNVFIAGPVSGTSMNPARSLGPAIVMGKYEGIWLYIIGPLIGTILGGFVYNLIRFTDMPLRELTRSGSILKSFS